MDFQVTAAEMMFSQTAATYLQMPHHCCQNLQVTESQRPQSLELDSAVGPASQSQGCWRRQICTIEMTSNHLTGPATVHIHAVKSLIQATLLDPTLHKLLRIPNTEACTSIVHAKAQKSQLQRTLLSSLTLQTRCWSGQCQMMLNQRCALHPDQD